MTVTFRTFVGNTTCESTDPESGVRCSQPSGHHIAFDCNEGVDNYWLGRADVNIYGDDDDADFSGRACGNHC